MDNTGVNIVPPPVPRRTHEYQPTNQLYNPIIMPYQYPYNNAFLNGQYNYGYQPTTGQATGVIHFDNFNIFRNAEESSRNVFQSIETIVNAFVSLANMLNSTHSAFFNSIRAILGVIEQFRAFKKFFISTFLFTIFRWARFLWRRILTLLRLKPRNYANSEVIWANINGQRNLNNSSSTLIFWLFALAGPYAIYKFITKMAMEASESRAWATGGSEHYNAQALYDYNAQNNDELSFSAFDMLRVAPKQRQPNVKDWLLASNMDGTKIGLVPINYIKLLNRVNEDNEKGN